MRSWIRPAAPASWLNRFASSGNNRPQSGQGHALNDVFDRLRSNVGGKANITQTACHAKSNTRAAGAMRNPHTTGQPTLEGESEKSDGCAVFDHGSKANGCPLRSP